MASTDTDRRARGVRRVDFSKLIEICGRSGETPAFEARGIELSGRGMQVRTKYLPEQGAPLVLRFEHEGEEAVIEGEVAWRREHDKGGEFGIKFTALDSNSVKVLKNVCDPALGKLKPVAPASKPEAAPEPREPGTAVRLHIQGLGAPMKARVFEAKGRKLHVGSQLEFLKVGRTLELEEVDGGDKRPAEIDSVTVSIDPRTQIPQLIVSLCYEDDETPEPSVVGDEDAPPRIESKRALRAAAAPAYVDEDDDAESPEDDEAQDDEDESMFKGRVAALASRAGAAVQEGGKGVAALGARATEGLFSLFRAGSRRGTASKDRSQRRTATSRSATASAQRGASRAGQKDRPRVQRSLHSRTTTDEAPSKKKRLLFAAAALVICASGAYPLFFAHDERRAPGAAAASPPTVVPAALPPAALPPAALPPAALPAASMAPVPSGLPPGAFPAATMLDTQAQLAAAAAPVSVEVPLFGTQQLSTLEAAPLTPPPETAIDEVGMAKDQTFAQPVVPSLTKSAATESAEPEKEPEAASPAGNSVWQAGKMHLPIIHRLRLDGAGTDLQGTDTPSGFSVLIPGRKVMETGAQIAKRDDRILSVNVKNTPAGGQIVFRFRKDVPGHKVRLRNDYVEFFINSEAP